MAFAHARRGISGVKLRFDDEKTAKLSIRNDKVQLRAFHLGFLQSFVDLLETPVGAITQSRILFALSTLLRNFPAAQAKFVEDRGMETLLRLFDRSESPKKILNLLVDFLLENQNRSADSLALFAPWCSRVPNHLSSISADDFDQIETTLQVLIPLADLCRWDLLELSGRVERFEQIPSPSESLRETLAKLRTILHQRLSSSDL